MAELDHLQIAKNLAGVGPANDGAALTHALIAIAERLPAPTTLDVDAYNPVQAHNNYSPEQM